MSKSKREKDRKPVKDSIEINFDNPVSSSKILFNHGRLSILNDDGIELTPDSIVHRRTSTRGNNKEKAISKMYMGQPKSVNMGFTTSLFDNYHYVFAIDTNTKKFAAHTVNCTAICQTILIHPHANEKYPNMQAAHCEFLGGFLFTESSLPAEKVGWFHFIDIILAQKKIRKGEKVIILSDHDINKHNDINNRVIDIVPGIKVPKDFYLGYASSDRLDDVVNEMVRFCDKEATSILNEQSEGTINNLLNNGTKGLFCNRITGISNGNDIRLPNYLYLG